MKVDDFKDSPSGTLIPTVEGQQAFIPNKLPPELNHQLLMEPLAKTAAAVGQLNGIAKLVENPFLVIRPLQRLEALLSSAMEGTYTTASALALAESGNIDVDESTKEVFNYIDAFLAAQKMLTHLPISNRILKVAQEKLLGGLSTARSKRPGEFKSHQNFIGGGNRRIESARFIPPPPDKTEELMAQLEGFINREDSRGIPPLIDAALTHYQFETIHPFADGNGRIGRMLITLQLQQAGVIEQPILYISPVVEGRKEEYAERLLMVSRDGDWTGWILFFLEVVSQSCESTTRTIQELLKLQTTYRNKLIEIGASSKLQMIVDNLFVRPVTDIPEAQREMQVSYPTASSAIRKLVEIGVLKELTYTSHPKRFICDDVIAVTDPEQRSSVSSA